MLQLTDWLPTTRKEMKLRGWEVADIILFSGDAYIDHPSFGVAVLGRLLEKQGWRVCIVPQPDWHGDFRDFTKLGRPRLFFGVSPGAMDSMVNKYTANRRLRAEDAYSPDGRHDMRPEYPSIVYTQILKRLYPDVPVVLGGIEASLRRLTHFDYWKNELRPCILKDSGADLIIYGMGELPVTELCQTIDAHLLHGREEAACTAEQFRSLVRHYPVKQTVTLEVLKDIPGLAIENPVHVLDRAKVSAHGAGVLFLRFCGRAVISRLLWVNRQREHFLPVELLSGFSHRPIPVRRAFYAFCKVCGVCGNLCCDDSFFHVLLIRQAKVLRRSNVAEKCCPGTGCDRPADCRRDVVVSRCNVGDKRPQHIEGRALADRLLNLHICRNLVESHVSRSFHDHLNALIPGALRQLAERYQLFNLPSKSTYPTSPSPFKSKSAVLRL